MTIEYVQLTPKYLEGSLDVMNNVFFAHENICKAIRLSDNQEAVKELRELVLYGAQDGVSVVAIDTKTDKVVGVAFNKIQSQSIEDHFFENLKKKCKQAPAIEVLDFMINVEGSCDLFEHCNTDCVIEILFLAVSPNYRGNNIGINLIKKSIEVTKKLLNGENVKIPVHGNKVLPLEPVPKVMTAIYTTFITQQMGQKLGFKIARRISYKDLYFQGKSYYSLMCEEDRVKTPDITLEYLKLSE